MYLLCVFVVCEYKVDLVARSDLSLFVVSNDTATTEIYTLTHSFPTRRSADLIRRRWSRARTSWAGRRSHRSDRRDHIPDTCSAPICASSRSGRSEEHTSELQSLMRISYAVFCLKKKILYQIAYDTSLAHSNHIN